MALLNRCCFWPNVRSGSFAAGFYILILYTMILTAGVFHLDAVSETVGMFIVSLVMLVFSGLCVITSILLLIGLCVDSRVLLIPWLISVTLTTSVDILASVYMFVESMFNAFMAVLFAVDFIVLSLNVYSIICVFSQYQEYCAGRGNPQVRGNRQPPQVEYRGGISDGTSANRLLNSSAATDSSTISVIQSSVPVVQSEITSTEDPSTACKTVEDMNTSEENVSHNNLEGSNTYQNGDHDSLLLVVDPSHS